MRVAIGVASVGTDTIYGETSKIFSQEIIQKITRYHQIKKTNSLLVLSVGKLDQDMIKRIWRAIN